jgi:hypothetical protein
MSLLKQADFCALAIVKGIMPSSQHFCTFFSQFAFNVLAVTGELAKYIDFITKVLPNTNNSPQLTSQKP